MKVIIDIPNYEFNNDVEDKFQDYFSRVRADLRDYPSHDKMCGNYEMETTDMFLASFKRLQVLPDNLTNGDMIKAMFPNQTIGCAIPITDRNGAKFYRTAINGVTDFTADWWNAPYEEKRGSEE